MSILVVLVCAAAALVVVGSALAVPFSLLPKVAPSIRVCVRQNGASSVQSAGVGDLGGAARFVSVEQPFVWGWINVKGSARLQLYVVEGVYGLKSLPSITAPAREALTKCLGPYAPPRSYYGHCSFGPRGSYCRRA